MIEGSGTIGVSMSRGGIAIDDNSRIKRLFKITGGTNPYTAVEVQLDEAEGVRVPTGVYDVDSAAKQLWEVNGITSIKPNRVVIGQPNPAGVGFLFDIGGIAPTTRTPLAFCVVKTGGVVTDIKITWQNPDGTLDCETVSECSGGEGSDCNTVWYCVDGIATEVAVGDAPPTGDEVVGPFPDQVTAEQACPAEPVIIEGCEYEYPPTLTATWVTGNGTCGCFTGAFELNYNGSAWSGVFTGCGGSVTVSLTPPPDATGFWFVAISGGGCSFLTLTSYSFVCGEIPPYTTSITVSGCCSGATQLLFSQ